MCVGAFNLITHVTMFNRSVRTRRTATGLGFGRRA
jgi:hypothetical protein